MAHELKKQLEIAYEDVLEEAKRPNSNGDLAIIGGIIKKMITTVNAKGEVRDQIAGGLGKIIMEYYSFAESELGTRILKLTDEYLGPFQGK